MVKGGDPLPLFSTGEATLEYCVQFCAPQYKSDTDILEQVQQRAVMMTVGLEHLTARKS